MPQPFLPRTDSAALHWMRNFASGIAVDPGKYSLTPQDAAAISAAVEVFASAYRVAIDPATRTCVAVLGKNNARRSAERICRQYAGLIKRDWRVSDEDKIALGVRPMPSARTRVKVPQTSPLLKLLGCTPGRQELRVFDSASPDRVAKPAGAAELQLFVTVDEAPVHDPTKAQFRRVIRRNKAHVSFEPSENGKVATYFARWCGPRGDVGPWSLPVSMRIAA